MAQELPKYRLAESSWSKMKAQCPVCNNTFSSWYCPNCGLPKNNNAYYEYEGETFYCGSNHFRREFGIVREYQLCSKCFAPNSYNANYCKSCGNKFTSSKGIFKDGHGWVDLGLSVLWATKAIDGTYYWNYAHNNSDDYRKLKNSELKDVATQMWGEKWRTPTKDEFEELVIKCKWEKCLDPTSNKHALKVIGPNGNYIIIPVIESDIDNSHCVLWTSTEDRIRPYKYAYAFYFEGYERFTRTLTAKQKKKIEFERARFKRELEFGDKFGILFKYAKYGEEWERKEEEWKRMENERMEEERQILRNMGDDSQERADNIKMDKERMRKLWLCTPVEMHYNEDNEFKNTIRPYPRICMSAILPVADKKWQGRL